MNDGLSQESGICVRDCAMGTLLDLLLGCNTLAVTYDEQVAPGIYRICDSNRLLLREHKSGIILLVQ